jgi:hypothetical protein
MSITLELSPELEKQLAAMDEEERGRFVADAVKEKIEAAEDEDGLLMIGPPSRRGPITLSPEAAARIRAAHEQPPGEPTEWMKKAIEHYKQLTGKTVKEGAFRTGAAPE